MFCWLVKCLKTRKWWIMEQGFIGVRINPRHTIPAVSDVLIEVNSPAYGDNPVRFHINSIHWYCVEKSIENQPQAPYVKFVECNLAILEVSIPMFTSTIYKTCKIGLINLFLVSTLIGFHFCQFSVAKYCFWLKLRNWYFSGLDDVIKRSLFATKLYFVLSRILR